MRLLELSFYDHVNMTALFNIYLAFQEATDVFILEAVFLTSMGVVHSDIISLC